MTDSGFTTHDPGLVQSSNVRASSHDRINRLSRQQRRPLRRVLVDPQHCRRWRRRRHGHGQRRVVTPRADQRRHQRYDRDEAEQSRRSGSPDDDRLEVVAAIRATVGEVRHEVLDEHDGDPVANLCRKQKKFSPVLGSSKASAVNPLVKTIRLICFVITLNDNGQIAFFQDRFD